MTERLSMWVVYDRPLDAPEHVVVRRWEIAGDGAAPTPDALYCPDLTAARAGLPPGLVRMGRGSGDDPTILEVWL